MGGSQGTMYLTDLRVSSNLNTNSIEFAYKPSSGMQSNIAKFTSGVSSLKFIKGGKHLIAKDYLNIHIWDVNNLSAPLSTIPVNDNLKNKIGDIFENGSIADKFEVAVSHDNSTVATGTYNNLFSLIDTHANTNYQYELSYKKLIPGKNITGKKVPLPAKMNYARKTVAMDFHPSRHSLVVASLNSFFTYIA